MIRSSSLVFICIYGTNEGSISVPFSSLLKEFDIEALEHHAQDIKRTVQQPWETEQDPEFE